MERTMEQELAWATGFVSGVLGERDPDVVADTVSRYWWGITQRSWPRCTVRLRWAWLKERARKPLPGMGEGSGHRDAFRAHPKRIVDIVGPARFPEPTRGALVNDMGRWIELQARTRSERLAIRAIRAGIPFKHAALRAGFSGDVLRRAYLRLRQRCRRLHPVD